jgi:DNA-binding IclR family transcriptional regulator
MPEEIAAIKAHNGTVKELAQKLGASIGTAHKLLQTRLLFAA